MMAAAAETMQDSSAWNPMTAAVAEMTQDSSAWNLMTAAAVEMTTRQQRSRMPERCSDTRESDEVKACRCREEDELGGMPLAWHMFHGRNGVISTKPQEGFARGTVFAQLDKPFHGRGGCNR
jgi:hypothetical protein